MKLLKENMKRFGTKNLLEQDLSYDQKVQKSKNRKKVNLEQLKKIIPVGKTATIMTAQEGYLVVVDEFNNYYELI